MKIGIDLLGVDKKQNIINFLNKYDDAKNKIVVYCLEEDFSKINNENNITKVICTEEVFISDDPARVHRKKKNSTMIKMLDDLKDNKIDISISGGSTGAYMASALFILGRIEGVKKPALGTMIPTLTNHKFFLTDLGANVEAKEEDLLNYAKLGKLYIQNMFNKENPTVALINIGSEENKGNKLYKETHKLLKQEVSNFKGNLEAREILEHNYDVVVADGFAGNMVLKTIEGTAITLGKLIKNIYLKNIISKFSALLVKNGLKDFKKKFDYSEYGGAILIGLKKPTIKIHGSADEKAVYYAVKQAKKIYEKKIYEKMNKLFEEN